MKMMLISAISDDQHQHGTNSSNGVVSVSKFAFWQGLVTLEFKSRLWKQIDGIFPGGQTKEADELLTEIQFVTNRVRHLRNRVGHCEPIFHLDVLSVLTDALTVIDYRSPEIGKWLRDTQQITTVYGNKPRVNSPGPCQIKVAS